MKFLFRTSFIFVLCLLCTVGCVTIKSDHFLIQNLDTNEKSDILTRKGIAHYEQQLQNRENYLRIPVARAFFENALLYNPENAVAREYLDKLTRFIDEQVKRNLELGRRYLAIQKKTEQDVFNLCYFVQKAFEVDPGNREVLDLKDEIRDEREKLINLYIERGNENLGSFDKSDTDAKKREAYLSAHNNFGRALLLDPGHSDASRSQTEVKDYLAGINEAQINSLLSKITAGNTAGFDESMRDIRFLDSRTDNRNRSRINDLMYKYNFVQARDSFGKKEYRQAESHINAALTVNRTREALDYRERIREARSAADARKTFGAAIADIDAMIVEGNLLDADHALRSLKSRTTDRNQNAQIDQRLAGLKKGLPSIYTRGVEAYQKEEYAEAVKYFETVVALDASFEQASSYLEKARSRLKILESF